MRPVMKNNFQIWPSIKKVWPTLFYNINDHWTILSTINTIFWYRVWSLYTGLTVLLWKLAWLLSTNFTSFSDYNSEEHFYSQIEFIKSVVNFSNLLSPEEWICIMIGDIDWTSFSYTSKINFWCKNNNLTIKIRNIPESNCLIDFFKNWVLT